MARKKIVFVIVEGPSDDEALGVILNRIYDNQTVYVHIMHRDITTDCGVTPSNILSRLGNEIRGYADSNHFKKSNFQEIIHLVDTDGAFIPDNKVIDDIKATKPIYSTLEIHSCNKKGIELRNHQKSANMLKLCNSKEIWSVPYKVYYMSTNLDHVLYNKLNSSDEEKETDSYAFVKKYKNQIPEFLTFISGSDFSVMNGYAESWEFIRQELHSLERHTNFGLCFENLKIE